MFCAALRYQQWFIQALLCLFAQQNKGTPHILWQKNKVLQSYVILRHARLPESPCVVLHYRVGINFKSIRRGRSPKTIFSGRHSMTECLAANRSVTAPPNERLIQNAINWPPEVRGSLALMKCNRIYSNNNQKDQSSMGPMQDAASSSSSGLVWKQNKKEKNLLTGLCREQTIILQWNLVFARMPHKNDFQSWWALLWKWLICWQQKAWCWFQVFSEMVPIWGRWFVLFFWRLTFEMQGQER